MFSRRKGGKDLWSLRSIGSYPTVFKIKSCCEPVPNELVNGCSAVQRAPVIYETVLFDANPASVQPRLQMVFCHAAPSIIA